MKKLLRSLGGAIAAFLLILVSIQAKAGHTMWSELTYSCVSPGVYLVQLKIYRDCAAIAMPATAMVNVKSPGCNTGRNITLQKLPNARIGNYYCASIPNVCTSSSRFNLEEVSYSSVVTFSAAEQSCPNWVLSWSECCRTNTVNILNGPSENFYAEAHLMLTPGLNNNSPLFGSVVSNLVAYNEPVQLSNYAIDMDGDSLVYSIQNPLKANNSIISYTTFPVEVIYNSDSTKFTGVTGPYSNAFPIFTYSLDWSQPMPLFPVKNFVLNGKNGSYKFIPRKLVQNQPANSGVNRYTIVTQVDEYRKLNGVPTKIGSVRRDMFLEVVDAAGNKNPAVITPTANGHAISETDIINLRPGIPLNFQFGTSDGNANDVIALTTDASDILQGAVFTKTSTNNPTGTITWTPTAAHIRDQVYYFHVLVVDNACPIKAHQIHTFGVKVTANGSVTGTPEKLAGPVSFSAFPNPFSEEITFNLNSETKAESIVIYNLLGQKVDVITLKTLGLGEQKVPYTNASKFAAGTYVARLVSGNQTLQTIKFTKLQ